VYFDRWGGEQPLLGSVRRVEPSGFTKISALGVEEQRVNVIADVVLPGDGRPPGDYFRVDARIVIWERPDVLQVPSGALFREGEQWAVYLIQDGRAVLRPIKLGRMSGASAEVLEGLQVGDQAILHPSDKIRDRARVVPRAPSE
jgi:HlyD family secretion protein